MREGAGAVVVSASTVAGGAAGAVGVTHCWFAFFGWGVVDLGFWLMDCGIWRV